MPEMTRSDFGKRVPKNADEIIQYINNAILYYEETQFWDNNPSETDQWETDLIQRYLSGDRSGNLASAPEPRY